MSEIREQTEKLLRLMDKHANPENWGKDRELVIAVEDLWEMIWGADPVTGDLNDPPPEGPRKPLRATKETLARLREPDDVV